MANTATLNASKPTIKQQPVTTVFPVNENSTTHNFVGVSPFEAYPYPLIPKRQTPQMPQGNRKREYIARVNAERKANRLKIATSDENNFKGRVINS
jgi:hypothetical protein